MFNTNDGERLNRREFLKWLTLMGLATSSSAGRSQPASDLPNILVVVFDTLSGRHSSLYGYPRRTMPNVERIASHSTVYHLHQSAGSFTSPGTASLLTGMYPWTHRALSLKSTMLDAISDRNLFRLLGGKGYTRLGFSQNMIVNILLNQFLESIDEFTLPNDISLKDYAFVDDLFSNDYGLAAQAEENYTQKPGSIFLFPFLLAMRSLDQGKTEREWHDSFPRGLPGFHNMLFPLSETMDWLMNELRAIPRPFFAYTHFMPPHDPYKPSVEFINTFSDGWTPPLKTEHFFSEGYSQKELDQLRNEYDEYIAYVDSEFGRLYEFLEVSGLTENTWVIFTSDHGEMFERGIWHHLTQVLYQPLLHVPLLISAPGQNERVDIRSLTSSVDLVPTLLHIIGESPPEWCEGEILPPFNATNDGSGRAVYSVEAKSNPKHGSLEKATVAICKNHLKLIYYTGYNGFDNEFEMYDLAEDPEELNDIFDPKYSRAAELKDELLESLARQNKLWQT